MISLLYSSFCLLVAALCVFRHHIRFPHKDPSIYFTVCKISSAEQHIQRAVDVFTAILSVFIVSNDPRCFPVCITLLLRLQEINYIYCVNSHCAVPRGGLRRLFIHFSKKLSVCSTKETTILSINHWSMAICCSYSVI